ESSVPLSSSWLVQLSTESSESFEQPDSETSPKTATAAAAADEKVARFMGRSLLVLDREQEVVEARGLCGPHDLVDETSVGGLIALDDREAERTELLLRAGCGALAVLQQVARLLGVVRQLPGLHLGGDLVRVLFEAVVERVDHHVRRLVLEDA